MYTEMSVDFDLLIISEQTPVKQRIISHILFSFVSSGLLGCRLTAHSLCCQERTKSSCLLCTVQTPLSLSISTLTEIVNK